ncbi:hypothetical protein BDM02DRAFT_3184783 [Thelephora ganbajun]|uniref:Uncharacterized protein n=1 Tax=Thelephora ganbajun TaxID=370292 RepID=A0ACB6ZN87_THEGA|nr:hypothetical protein BDM02DRAFT_3184783 [Thelephora ganbajun]
MSAITEDTSAPRAEEEHDPHFEPVIKLTEQVEVRTNEEDEDILFKLRSKLFRFATESNEWKERGTGDVRLLQHKESKKIRLVMRRDKTLKVCANHLITSDMKLQPNVGSDRSWVWKVAADYSEDPPTSETLAIRFANSDLANDFKKAFEDAQKSNAELSSKAVPPKESVPAPAEAQGEEKAEATKEEAKKETEEETKAE